MDRVEQRSKRIAQSILENESLTADLDDPQAQALLDWGIERAETIAQSTTGLDDEAAELAMDPRLRALRRLMRQVNQWMQGGQDMDQRAGAERLSQMIDQAQIVHGPGYAPPGPEQRQAFLRLRSEWTDDRTQMLDRLLTLLSHQPEPIDQEENDDQA